MTTKPAALRKSQEERRSTSERRLIDAVISIAANEGFQAVTFYAISQKSGYSRGLAPQKFGSKKALQAALIDYLQEQTKSSGELRKLDKSSGLEALLGYIDFAFDKLSSSEEFKAYTVLLAGNVSELSDLRSLFAEGHEHTKQQLTRFIERGLQDGSIKTQIEPEVAASSACLLFLGSSIQSLTDQTADMEKAKQDALSFLRTSLST